MRAPYLALLRISSDNKCWANAVSDEYKHEVFTLFHVSWISFLKYTLLCFSFHDCLFLAKFFNLLWKLPGESSFLPVLHFVKVRPTALKIMPEENDFKQIQTELERNMN